MLRILWIGAKVGGAYVVSNYLGEKLMRYVPHANDAPPPAWATGVRVGSKVAIGVTTYILETMVVG